MAYFRKEQEPEFYNDGTPRFSKSIYAVGYRDTFKPGYIRSKLYAEVTHTHKRDVISYPKEDGSDLRNYNKDEQMELFRHYVRPATSQVTFVEGTERGRTHFPLILGIASNDAMKITGAPLTPDDDLSPHSIKAVQNLKNRGLLDKSISTPNEPTNTMSFLSSPFLSSFGEYEELSDAEVKEGKETLRGLLRVNKNLSSQFDPVTKPQQETHTQLELDL